MEPLDPFVIRMKQDEDEILNLLSFWGEFYLLKNGALLHFTTQKVKVGILKLLTDKLKIKITSFLRRKELI